VDATPAAEPAAEEAPVPEPTPEPEPAPEPIPEPEPAMAGIAADPLANDPLGISQEDLTPATDFGDDDEGTHEPDVDDGPDDQPDLT
jgi:hypothetical protein